MFLLGKLVGYAYGHFRTCQSPFLTCHILSISLGNPLKIISFLEIYDSVPKGHPLRWCRLSPWRLKWRESWVLKGDWLKVEWLCQILWEKDFLWRAGQVSWLRSILKLWFKISFKTKTIGPIESLSGSREWERKVTMKKSARFFKWDKEGD